MNKQESAAAVIELPAQIQFPTGEIASVGCIHIRPAIEQDLPQILSLIRGLGDYEHLPVPATEEQLRDALFGRQPVAEVLLAFVENESAGFAVFFTTVCAMLGRRGLFLENIFVKRELRSMGIGDALLTRLAEIAVERKAARIQWSVLNWNESAARFYEAKGAASLDDWTIFRMDEPAIHRLAGRTNIGDLTPEESSPAKDIHDKQMRLEFFS